MILYYALISLLVATVPIVYRLLKGPSIADRVAAFDVLNCIVIGMLGVFAIKNESTFYIDVVLTLSFVVFLGTIAFAYYLIKMKHNNKEN
jgi:multicomponent Na+:H+ antiporter subunit F